MMDLLSLLWLAALSIAGTARGFEISRIAGPSVIVNGTVPLLVLDCQYDADRYDTRGLTVKWYLKTKIRYQVYQWIPNTAPQALSILKGRVDLSYRASNHSQEMYRALAIQRPTTAHSGDYTCAVSTFLNDDLKTKRVIVYAPATEIFITYTKPTVESVRVLCVASGLFPEPRMALFTSGSNMKSTRLASSFNAAFVPSMNSYNVTSVATIRDTRLEDETVFECRLAIPGTDYRLRENILYYPGVSALESTSSASSRTALRLSSTAVTLVLLALDVVAALL